MAPLPDAWSKSSLGTLLEGCSWQWALEKVYGQEGGGTPATVLGTAYHAGVEWWCRSRLIEQRDRVAMFADDGGKAAMFAVAMEALDREVEQLDDEQWALHGTDYATLVEELAAALEHWWSTPIRDGQPGAGMSIRERIMRWRIIAVEPAFNEQPTEGLTGVRGFIDLLVWDPDDAVYRVVDHKSAGSFGRWAHDGAGHEIEAGVYVVGAEIASHLPAHGPVVMEWQITRKKLSAHARFEGVRVIEFEVQDVHRLWLEDRIKLANRIVADDLFETNPGWNLCSAKWCPHFRGCQVDGDLHPRQLMAQG